MRVKIEAESDRSRIESKDEPLQSCHRNSISETRSEHIEDWGLQKVREVVVNTAFPQIICAQA